MSEERHVAVVAGNGLSIAFSKTLLLENITRTLLSELSSIAPDGSPVLKAVQSVAQRVEHDDKPDESDFEKLVGAFETQAGLILELEQLVDLVPSKSEQIREHIKATADFARRVCDIGTNIVLDCILKNSPTTVDRTSHMHGFFKNLIHTFDGHITIANLNYDSMIMSCLLQIDAPMCDMALGWGESKINITNTKDDDTKEVVGSYLAKPMRLTSDFPAESKYRLRLLHPHGSVTYWKSRKDGKVVKIPLEALRKHNLLGSTKYERPSMSPAVVLANSLEKPRRVKEAPFNLGYEALGKGLDESEHWLIAGYSFRDHSINETLRESFQKRKSKPQVLVSTLGWDPPEERIHNAFGLTSTDGDPAFWLSIDRGGVENLNLSPEWRSFIK